MAGYLGEVGDSRWSYEGEGFLYSLRFGDVYGSRSGHLGQSEEVFWGGVRAHVEKRAKEGEVVLCEWGFGLGINFLSTWRGWEGLEKEKGSRLIYVGFEGYPLDVFSLGLAHGHLGVKGGELGEKSRILRRNWRCEAGYFTVQVAVDVTLILVMGDVEHGMRHWDVGLSDGWYMDGFSPRVNPEMYSVALCEYMAKKSREGAVVVGYSVASCVKKGLEGVGFSVHKRKGYGKKRACLEALWKGEGVPKKVYKRTGKDRVTIVGGGIAGLCCAYRCKERGLEVRLVTAKEGGGSSCIPTALVTPGIADVKSDVGVLRLMGFAHAVKFYREVASGSVRGEGSLHLLRGLREKQMWKRGGERALWDYGMKRVSREVASEIAGVEVGVDAVLWRESLCMETQGLREKLGEGIDERIEACVTGVERRGEAWVLKEGEREVCGGGLVVLACGDTIGKVWGRKLRTKLRCEEAFLGWFGGEGVKVPRCTLMDSVYMTPLWQDGKGEWNSTLGAVSGSGGGESFEDRLWQRAEGSFSWCERQAWRGCFRAVRVKTGDRLPLCGGVKGEGLGSLCMLGGLGSHGFTLAPLLSEVLVSEMLGGPVVLPRRLREAIEV